MVKIIHNDPFTESFRSKSLNLPLLTVYKASKKVWVEVPDFDTLQSSSKIMGLPVEESSYFSLTFSNHPERYEDVFEQLSSYNISFGKQGGYRILCFFPGKISYSQLKEIAQEISLWLTEQGFIVSRNLGLLKDGLLESKPTSTFLD